MRTTIDIDETALGVLRDLATVEKRTIGKVASDLILEAVRNRRAKVPMVRNGIPLLERRTDVVITNELIDRIREQEGV
ncbi:MAG: hypothetical protein JNM66_30015 [Bryobacterales bacterium]|nr:hypothetical protein [Bryobacterales bacterium]